MTLIEPHAVAETQNTAQRVQCRPRSSTHLPCSYFMVLIGAIKYAGSLFFCCFLGFGWGGGHYSNEKLGKAFQSSVSTSLEGRLDNGKGKKKFFFFLKEEDLFMPFCK